MLDFDNVSKSYRAKGRSVCALADVSFALRPGQFVAMCGPSGSGKSTLLLLAGGLLRPDDGRVVLAGRDVDTLSAEERAAVRAEHIGFVFQQFHLLPYLTVLENVLAASLGLPNETPRDASAQRDRATGLLERFGLADRATHVPAELSTGERQRTALARALLNEPQLILADEPTGNLDAAASETVLAALAEVAAQGTAVLLVTHDPQAAGRAERTLELHEGRMRHALAPGGVA